jgi:hypothetical protein
MAMLITKWLLAIVHVLLVLAIDIYTRAILGMIITLNPLASVYWPFRQWLLGIGLGLLAILGFEFTKF